MFLECVHDVFMDLEGEVISNDTLQVVEGYNLARQFQKNPVVLAQCLGVIELDIWSTQTRPHETQYFHHDHESYNSWYDL